MPTPCEGVPAPREGRSSALIPAPEWLSGLPGRKATQGPSTPRGGRTSPVTSGGNQIEGDDSSDAEACHTKDDQVPWGVVPPLHESATRENGEHGSPTASRTPPMHEGLTRSKREQGTPSEIHKPPGPVSTANRRLNLSRCAIHETLGWHSPDLEDLHHGNVLSASCSACKGLSRIQEGLPPFRVHLHDR
jgi:hypothetical protein